MKQTIKQLERHGFKIFVAEDEREAGVKIKELFAKFLENHGEEQPIVSYGDSVTLHQIDNALGDEGGVLDEMRKNPTIKFLDGFRKDDIRADKLKIRREAVLSDFYITGVNAISEEGSLYWVDMVGNRVASVSIGAKEVVIVAGRNKIVPTDADLDNRIKTIAAPLNIARHEGYRTPCAKTGHCMDCNSPDRICNVRLTMQRCYPAGRITVILINKELGL